MSAAVDVARMEEILRGLGVEMKVGGCGCCGSPWIEFRFNGQEFKSEYEQLDTSKNRTAAAVMAKAELVEKYAAAREARLAAEYPYKRLARIQENLADEMRRIQRDFDNKMDDLMLRHWYAAK